MGRQQTSWRWGEREGEADGMSGGEDDQESLLKIEHICCGGDDARILGDED